MDIVFLGNFINHHQIPFCKAVSRKLTDGTFTFVQTEEMSEERKEMGWEVKEEDVPYLRKLYEEEEECKRLIDECDVLIAGWTDRTDLIIARMKQNKLTLRISERIYREGQWKAISPRGLVHKYLEHTRFRKSNAYLLCCGAYVASDFKLIRAYPNKMYKFGYFPSVRKYDLPKLFEAKDQSGMIEIVFAGRFLKLKHPEYMIWLARDLKHESERREAAGKHPLPDFRIHMIGDGEMEHPLRRVVTEMQLLDYVLFYGFQSPDKVRSIMERSHILVFPSDHLEGWGAVVNEGMNSACAVVACSDAGSVPFLIDQWENGMAFPEGDYDKLKAAVLYLITHKKEREKMAEKAYRTITEVWNAQNAADTLLYMIEGWKEGLDHPPGEGPLSKAEPISPSQMFQHMEEERAKRRKQ